MHGSEHLGDDSSSNEPLHGDSDQTHGWSEDKGAGELVGGGGRSLGVAFGACSIVRTLASMLRETRAKGRLLSRGVGEWDNRPQPQKTHTYVWDRV